MKGHQAPQAQQVHLVSVVLQEQLAPLVCQGGQVHKGHQVLLARREPRVKKAPKAQLVVMVSKDRLDFLAQQVLLGHLEKMETRVKLVSRDRRGPKVTKGSRVLQALPDHKAQLDNQVQLELMENQGLEDNKVCLAKKAMKGQEVFQALQVQLGCRVCLGHLVKKEKQGMLAKWVPQVLLGQGDHLDHQELMGHKVHRAGLETLDPLVRRENPENQESLACLETLAPQAQKEREGRRGNRVHLGQPDHQAPKALQVTMAPKAVPVLLVFLVTPDLQENLAQLVKMVPQGTKVMTGNLAKLAPLDLQENLVHQGHQEKEAHLGQQDLKAGKERREPRVKLVWKDLLGKQALWAPRDPQENLAQMDFEAFLAQWVNKVFQDHQVLMDPQVQWAHLVYLA